MTLPRLEPKDESYSMYKSMLEVMLAWAGAPRSKEPGQCVFFEDWWRVRGLVDVWMALDALGHQIWLGNARDEGFSVKIIEVKGAWKLYEVVCCIPLPSLIKRGCVQSIVLAVDTLYTKFLPSRGRSLLSTRVPGRHCVCVSYVC